MNYHEGDQQYQFLLTEAEQNDPHLVIENLFLYAHFPEIILLLENIKKWLFNKDYPFAMDTREHLNMIYFFEKLHMLIEAAKIIELQKKQ